MGTAKPERDFETFSPGILDENRPSLRENDRESFSLEQVNVALDSMRNKTAARPVLSM